MRALFFKKYPSSLSDGFLNKIASLPVHSITSIDVVPIPKDLTTRTLQKKYLGIESDIIKQQRVRNKNNDFSSEISYAKRTEKKEIEEIMDDVRENDQCLFYVAVTVILVAESKEELESVTETLEAIGKGDSVTIDTHYLKQREALNTALPIGVRQVETMRTMLTQSVAALMPFNVQELNDNGGNYYGINQISKNINVGNRKKLINGNGFIFGVPGSGKSFFAKQEMGNVFLNTEDDVIVIDPMNEYFDIAKTFKGAIVNLSAYTKNYVNPLHADLAHINEKGIRDVIADKSEFMLGLCDQLLGNALNKKHHSIIDRCIRDLYMKAWRTKQVPLMTDFYQILKSQNEMEAQELALALELFVEGSLNIFNHHTNVDVDNRFTVYGIQDLGAQLAPVAMLVMMEGANPEQLDKGIGHMSDTAPLCTKGNAVCAGHNGSRRGVFFTYLCNIEIGAKVVVINKDDVKHTYQAAEMKVVNPYDAWVTDESEEEVLTLFTCANHGTNRFVVKCVPVEEDTP